MSWTTLPSALVYVSVYMMLPDTLTVAAVAVVRWVRTAHMGYIVGKHSRHSAINEIICHSLCSAHIPSQREPTGLYTTQTRPDGLTLVPWRSGKCLVWDATVVDTLAPSHVVHTRCTPGAAAAAAEDLKISKYSGRLPSTYEFIPLGFETLGSVGPAAQEFIATLGIL